MPAAAAAGIVPWSAPPDAFTLIVSPTSPVKPVAVLPKGSRAIRRTAGVIVAPACVVLGCTVNASLAAAAGEIVNAVLTVLSGAPVAWSVYPEAGLSIAMLLNVAIPASAASLVLTAIDPTC